MWNFLLLAIAVVPPHAAAGPATRPAAPRDSVRAVVKRGFEIYATSDEALRLAMQQVSYAEQQFGRYMGHSPPRLAVLILDAPDRVEGFDLDTLRKRGLPVLRWVSTATHGLAPARPPGAPAAPGEPPPLSYEAGRAYFEAFAATRRAGAVEPRVPDWFGEAIGRLCEMPALQNYRLDYMRDRIEQRIPLPELFRMERPAGAARSDAGGKASKRPSAAGRSSAASGRAGPGGSERAAVFSAEALSVGSFIAEIEGERFVGRIGEALIAGKTVGDALVDAVVVLSKAEALEGQWVEWVTRKR